MSSNTRQPLSESLPPSARSIALILAQEPSVGDVHPTVLHLLLDFAHRYTSQVLNDATVYAEHAGRGGPGGSTATKVEIEDVMLAIQARVGWEFGGRVPKEYLTQLAAQKNASPLPSVPEVFGVRLPPLADTLTAVTFDLVPHKPPPVTQQYDEVVEEIEDEDEEEEEEAIETTRRSTRSARQAPLPAPVQAVQSVDVDMLGADEHSEDEDDEEGLFGDENENEAASSDGAMSEVLPANSGIKRKLVEDDDYD